MDFFYEVVWSFFGVNCNNNNKKIVLVWDSLISILVMDEGIFKHISVDLFKLSIVITIR